MSIGALGGYTAAETMTGGANGFGDITSEEFVKILVEELTNQDPLKPNDTQQVLEQLSSLRNIESQMNLQQSLESLVMQNEMAQAGGLIGKKVEGLDLYDTTVSGIVTAVRVIDGQAVLELDSGKQLLMGRVMRITGVNPPTSSGDGA